MPVAVVVVVVVVVAVVVAVDDDVVDNDVDTDDWSMLLFNEMPSVTIPGSLKSSSSLVKLSIQKAHQRLDSFTKKKLLRLKMEKIAIFLKIWFLGCLRNLVRRILRRQFSFLFQLRRENQSR